MLIGPPNFFTLACRDVNRMARFLVALGWPEAPSSESLHRVFQCPNGLAIAVYAAANYEPHLGPLVSGFRGFTVGINVGDAAEVDAAYRLLQQLGDVELLEEPFDSPHGFRGFSFRDPEGNIWDIAWKRGSIVNARGDLTWN